MLTVIARLAALLLGAVAGWLLCARSTRGLVVRLEEDAHISRQATAAAVAEVARLRERAATAQAEAERLRAGAVR